MAAGNPLPQWAAAAAAAWEEPGDITRQVSAAGLAASSNSSSERSKVSERSTVLGCSPVREEELQQPLGGPAARRAAVAPTGRFG